VRDRFVVLSTDDAVLEQLHRDAPSLTLGLAGWFETLDELQRAERLGCDQIAVPVATGSEWLVQAAHVLGIEVIGWLGNTTNEINAFLAWGVDSIVSDFPSVAKQVLATR
jgi:glycerophosphoryl diester phosphodiesterase